MSGRAFAFDLALFLPLLFSSVIPAGNPLSARFADERTAVILSNAKDPRLLFRVLSPMPAIRPEG